MSRAVLAALLLVAPNAGALALVEGDGSRARLRVALEEGNLSARALEGAPRLDGRPIGPETVHLDPVRIEPWRGFERTVSLALGGSGQLLLEDEASGLLVDLDEGAQQADGANGSRPERSGDPAPGNRSAPPRSGAEDDPRRDHAGPRKATVPDAPAFPKQGPPEGQANASRPRIAAEQGPKPRPEAAGPTEDADPWPRILALGALVLAAGAPLVLRRLSPSGSNGEARGSSDLDRAPYPWLDPGAGGPGRRKP